MIHLFWAYSHGLTEDRLRLYFDEFAVIPVAPPSLEHQRRIVNVLDKWDRAINQAECLLAAKRRQFSASSEALLGADRNDAKITTNWPRKKLGDVITLTSGQHVASALVNNAGAGIPYLTGPSDFSIAHPIASAWVKAPPVMCSAGDILVTVKGSGVGSMSIADQNYCISRQLMAITPQGVEAKFLRHLCEREIFTIAQNAHGMIPQLTREDICNIVISLPPRADQIKISEILDCIRGQENLIERLIDCLRRQKDGLVRKLIIDDFPLDERLNPLSVTNRAAFLQGAI